MVAAFTPLRDVCAQVGSRGRVQGHEARFVEFRFDNPQMGRISIQDDIVVGQS
jgi:hypothetical protein